MLIDLLKHKIRPIGIIHVGAHYGQEYPTYKKMGAPNVIFIEPCASAYAVLDHRYGLNPDVTLVRAACGEYRGQVEMNIEISNQGQSNSILPLGTHAKHYPEIKFIEKELVEMITLDGLNTKDYDFLMIDVQGYELNVLKGATETIKKCNWVYTEVNFEQVYEGCPHVDEIDAFLSEFTPIDSVYTKQGWGDRLYKRIKKSK